MIDPISQRLREMEAFDLAMVGEGRYEMLISAEKIQPGIYRVIEEDTSNGRRESYISPTKGILEMGLSPAKK